MKVNTDNNNTEGLRRRIFSWCLIPLALFPLAALLTYDWRAMPQLCVPPMHTVNWIGALGDHFAYYSYLFLGLAAWALPIVSLVAALLCVLGRRGGALVRAFWCFLALVALACLIEAVGAHTPSIALMARRVNIAVPGGVAGYLLMTRFLVPLVSDFGASILMLLVFIVATIAAIGLSNIAFLFRGIFAWALAGSPKAAEGSESGEAAEDPYEAARQAREAAREAARAEKEAVRAEKERLREEKLAAREAERAEKEAARAAKDAERAAKESERRAAEERREADQRAEAAQHEAPLPAEDDLLARAAAARKAAQAQRKQDVAAVVAPPPKPAPKPAAKPAPLPAPVDEPPPVEDKGPYILPSLSLLNPIKQSEADHSDVSEMSQRLVDTLKLFDIDAKIAYDVQGPVVTKYALMLAPGTRYSAVTNLADNIKGALHAKSLRIEAPIPGEEAIGVEVPNRRPAGISFREIFESDAWRLSKAELPLLFGKRADGKELVADLASMPHMLVAGATGQGKSVCLNSLICGLLMSRTPEQLKLIMVDPKCVEFTPYASIPHLLVPVITDNKKVVFSLHWAVAEMEKRLKLFARARVRNIYDFNHRPNVTQTDIFGDDTQIGGDMPKTVPYIVIIIDEAADLIGQCGKEVNPDIQRITQKARAAGIHLILATQRPDAKIITGAIKANIPGRVAFKTASSVDSRTILDDTGAENLIGRGDMLFRGKDGILVRAQGAWIADDEIARVTAFIEEHSNVQFDEKFSKNLGRVKEAGIEDPFAALDEEEANSEASKAEAQQQREQVKAEENASDFKKAVECIINTNRASTSHFQRKLGWGYNHSAKIMDMLEDAGIIGPQSGAGPRPIIMDQDQLLAIFNGNGATDIAASAEPSPDEAGADGVALADVVADESDDFSQEDQQ